MTNLASRVGRLNANLTARERALLTIRAELAGEAPDPELKRTMPDEQREEYRRLMVLYYTANAEIGVVALSLRLQAALIGRLAGIGEVLLSASDVAAQDVEEALKPQRVRRMKGDTVSLPEYLTHLAAECRETLLKESLQRWQEARSIELVWDEIGEEFDGEEFVRADNREHIAAAKEIFSRVFADCGRKARPPEPKPEFVEHHRELVAHCLRMFGLEDSD
jgi:hypothetical protein